VFEIPSIQPYRLKVILVPQPVATNSDFSIHATHIIPGKALVLKQLSATMKTNIYLDNIGIMMTSLCIL